MNKIERKMMRKKRKPLQEEMSFFDHIDALRMHLIRAFLAIIIFTCLSFCYYDFIFDAIIMGPKRADFWTYRMMCHIGDLFHMGPDFCIKDIPFNIINTDMAGQFTLQMNSSLLIGLVLAFPYIMFELWCFIKPALHAKERQSLGGFAGYASILFFLGVLFGYFIITPLSINFLANFQVSKLIQNQITVDSYLSTIATLSIATGIVFEMPVLIFILSKLGLMTPQLMRSSRRYAIIIILIIAAIVTPTPDALTMMTISLPLFLLYELSIVVSTKVQKQKNENALVGCVS